MERPTSDAPVAQRMRMLTMIWAALATSVGAYALVLFLLNEQGGLPLAPMGAENMDTIRIALLLMAATAASTVFTLPGMLLKPAMLRERLRKQGIDPANMDKERLGQALFAQYQVVGVIRWAMGESVGLLGLVAALLGGLGPLAYGLLAASAALVVMSRPSMDDLDRLVVAVRGM